MEMIYLGKVLVKNTHNRSLVSFSFDSDIQGYMGCSKSLDSRIFLGNCFELRNFKNECGFPDLYCTQQLCTLVLRCKLSYKNSRQTIKQHIQSSLFMMSDHQPSPLFRDPWEGCGNGFGWFHHQKTCRIPWSFPVCGCKVDEKKSARLRIS